MLSGRKTRIDPRARSGWSLIPRLRTHGDELEGGAFRPGPVVVHLIRNIVDDSARPYCNSVILIEFRSSADEERSGQDGDETLILM